MDDVPDEVGTGTRKILPWVWVACLLPLLGFWTYGLFDLDEGFYAGAAAEMLRRGEWTTPYFNGQTWFEKPILLYWLSMPTIALFGGEFGTRLPSVLCGAGTLVVVFMAAKRWLGTSSAIWSILVLGSSVLAVGVNRMMLADPPLVLAMTLCLLAFYASLSLDDGRKARVLAGAALGVAVLAKGPVAGLLFLLIAGWTLWREPELRPRFRGGWFVAILAFCVVVGLWYVPAYLANGQVFVQKFLIDQNIGRFTGGDTAHTLVGPENWVFFLVILLVGMLPWSLWIPRAWPRRNRDLGPEAIFLRFCAAWAGVVLLFFSVSGAKLPHYIAPALPALSILVGDWLGRRRNPSVDMTSWRRLAGPLATCVIVAVVAQATFWGYYHGYGAPGSTINRAFIGFHEELHDLTRWVKRQGGPVAIYQMSRRDKADLGTGTVQLRETSHPSILFILDETVLDTELLGELIAATETGKGRHIRYSIWVLTRADRFTNQDVSMAISFGLDLRDETPWPTRFYKVYRLTGYLK